MFKGVTSKIKLSTITSIMLLLFFSSTMGEYNPTVLRFSFSDFGCKKPIYFNSKTKDLKLRIPADTTFPALDEFMNKHQINYIPKFNAINGSTLLLVLKWDEFKGFKFDKKVELTKELLNITLTLFPDNLHNISIYDSTYNDLAFLSATRANEIEIDIF